MIFVVIYIFDVNLIINIEKIKFIVKNLNLFQTIHTILSNEILILLKRYNEKCNY